MHKHNKSLIVKDIDLFENYKLTIRFENSSEVMTIIAESECCDINSFVFDEDVKTLCGRNISNIVETEDVEAEKYNGDYDSQRKFIITVTCSHSSVLQQLREKSQIWQTLPKDIFILISGKLEESQYNFFRMNSSNGYYSGNLGIYVE